MLEIFKNLLDLTKKVELITDEYGNPQIAITENGNTWYFTHNVNEANYYITKYRSPDMLILDRINGFTKRFGNDKDFTNFIEKLKPSLEKLGYVF